MSDSSVAEERQVSEIQLYTRTRHDLFCGGLQEIYTQITF